MKKILSILSLILFLSFSTFAQNTNLKYYSDYTKDFSGYAVAVYQGTLKDLGITEKEFFDRISETIDDTIPPVQKLTKKNNWLFRQALNEYDYEKDEIYIVACAESVYSSEALIFLVLVKGKNDVTWRAYNLKEDDISTLESLFENKAEVTPIPSSEEYISGQREILDWYTSLGIIQTTTCDDPPATVRVEVGLAYKKGDDATKTEITTRTVELKAFLRRYFSGKTAAELRNTNNEDALENEIKNGINDKILSSSRVRDVVFMQKDVIEQN
ncbi:flagellar basal body-associated FliL family protein [Treponema bryantii]|uniref:flagellar basal body-associated FliL family protein n=1 Tax=Treponema bryantii TaxID=163 RepID=UPI002B3074A6|nr:hypothetical protein TRBR_17470 [Treponema bryantii]